MLGKNAEALAKGGAIEMHWGRDSIGPQTIALKGFSKGIWRSAILNIADIHGNNHHSIFSEFSVMQFVKPSFALKLYIM